MKKSGSIIEAVAGAVIFVIGLVLCFHNYVQKGNTAYAVSLLVAIAGVIVLIAGIVNRWCMGRFSRSSRYDNQRFDNGVCNERTKDLYFKALYRSDCGICST